tara:strand:+ start:27 stop:458 length:432 start_codon:yes stop_codon:yes gene_type:complete
VGKNKKSGAGFVVFRSDTVGTENPLILALLQDDGIYDIPKGRIDEGESDIAAAKRECFEECSIMISDEDMMFSDASPFKYGALTTFCAKTSKVPNITINPHTGILEHAGFKWVDKDQFCNNCLNYLVHPVNHFYSEHDKAYND